MKTLSLIILLLGVGVGTPPFSACASKPQPVTIRVRLLYLKNGKPAKHQLVILDLINPQRMTARQWRYQTLSPRQYTGSDGVAIFRIPKPLSRFVYFGIDNGQIEGCASAPAPLLTQVLQRGVTIGVDKEYGKSCKGDRSLIKRLAAKPGEIVIFVRKLTWWDNLTRY